jgi:hypothetical protein
MFRRAAMSTLVVTAALALAACDPNMFQGPVAVRAVADDLQVAVCTEGTIDSLVALERVAVPQRKWVEFWSSSQRVVIDYSETFIGGRAQDGVAIGSYRRPDLSPGTEYDFQLMQGERVVASAVLSVPAEGVPSSDWLQSDGSITTDACPPQTAPAPSNASTSG